MAATADAIQHYLQVLLCPLSLSAFCNNDMQIVQKVGAEWRRGKPKELKAKAKGIRDAQAAATATEKKDKANSNNL